MKEVSRKQFKVLKEKHKMEHVGFASPAPWHGYTNTIEYYEGEGIKGEVRWMDEMNIKFYMEASDDQAK